MEIDKIKAGERITADLMNIPLRRIYNSIKTEYLGNVNVEAKTIGDTSIVTVEKSFYLPQVPIAKNIKIFIHWTMLYSDPTGFHHYVNLYDKSNSLVSLVETGWEWSEGLLRFRATNGDSVQSTAHNNWLMLEFQHQNENYYTLEYTYGRQVWHPSAFHFFLDTGSVINQFQTNIQPLQDMAISRKEHFLNAINYVHLQTFANSIPDMPYGEKGHLFVMRMGDLLKSPQPFFVFFRLPLVLQGKTFSYASEIYVNVRETRNTEITHSFYITEYELIDDGYGSSYFAILPIELLGYAEGIQDDIFLKDVVLDVRHKVVGGDWQPINGVTLNWCLKRYIKQMDTSFETERAWLHQRLINDIFETSNLLVFNPQEIVQHLVLSRNQLAPQSLIDATTDLFF